MASQDVEKLFLQNQEREQALRNLLKTRPSESRDVQALRGEIRAAYSGILGMDPEFCASKDVELLLWKNCYYKRIEDFRKRLRKYSHLSGSPERSKAFEAREHLHGICQAFARFLGEAAEFYSSLLRRFEAMQHQYSNGGQAVGSTERRTRLARLVVLSINRCFIFLGDLARYRELHGENSAKDWSGAERFYLHALAVLPTSGNPHNQLAVLATYTDAECVSVYRYCRSLMIENPFQTAHENLTLLFEKNKTKAFGVPPGGSEGGKDGFAGSGRDLAASSGGGVGPTQHHSKGKGKGSGGRGNTGALLKSFLRRFVRLHGMIFSGRSEDLEDFPSIFETAIADFRTLLSNSAFGDALLLKMVVICIFSVTHVADASTSTNSSGSSSSDLRSESFSNSGSVADGGGSSLDGASNAGSTGTQVGGSEAAAAAASKAEEVRRNARLSYPLALAFGVSAQIGRHVRTQEPTHPSQGSQHGGGHNRGHRHGSHGGSDGGMLHGHHHHPHSQHHVTPPAPVMVYGVDTKVRPSSNQPQPRPLGSRLLGPVVLFCDWLTAQSRFLCVAEEERSAGGGSAGRGAGVARRGVASVAVQEGEMRDQFWGVIQRLAATLPDQDPTNQADAFPGDPLGRRRPLKEHVELRGFLPLADLYKKRYAMDGHAVAAVPDDCAGSVRIRGLKAFVAAVTGDPSTAAPTLHYDADMMIGHHRERSEYSGWSEASGGSGSHIGLDNRPFEMALRQQAPRSQFGRAPPGMNSGGGGGSLVGTSGERTSRSASGPGGMGSGYFGSGGSMGGGGGSDHGGRRSSRGPGSGAGAQHGRNSSVGAIRVPGPQQQQQHPAQVAHSRHHSQPIVPSLGTGGNGGLGDMDPSGQYYHPPLHRINSQASGVSVVSGSGGQGRMYSSRQSDTGSATGSRHSLDSGTRFYESRHLMPPGAPGGYNPTVHSIASNEGSGSGSSGVGSSTHGSAHDNRSIGAWSAPGGRSGGGVGSGGGGGGSWAAEQDQRSSFRSDAGSGDDNDVAYMTPRFRAQSTRRSTGGGGGPVVMVRGQDGVVGGGSSSRGDEGGGAVPGGGSDLGSKRGSGLIGGGIWTGTSVQQQDVVPSSSQQEDPSDQNEDGERYPPDHSSIFEWAPWRGVLGGGGSAHTPVGTPATAPLDASSGHRGMSPSPRSSSPPGIGSVGGSGNGLGSGGDGSQQNHNRTPSFDHRASTESGGLGYVHSPFQRSPQLQQQQQNFELQQTFSQTSSHRRQTSTGATRSPPSTYEHHGAVEPPGFPGGIPGSPSTAAPRSGSVGNFQRERSPGQPGDQRRFSLSGPPQSSGGAPRRPQYPPPAYQQQQQQQATVHSSPPLQPQRQRHEQQLYGRRSSSPGTSSRGGPGDPGYASGGSPVTPVLSQRAPPSTLPHAYTSGAGGGSSSVANNHDDASSMFSSNVSGHSTYSGFSGLSAFNAFGGSDLGSVGGGRDGGALGSGGGGGGHGSGSGTTSIVSAALPWRTPTPPTASSKADPAAVDEGSTTGTYAAAHGSTGGALGWGAVMGTGGGGAAGVGNDQG